MAGKAPPLSEKGGHEVPARRQEDTGDSYTAARFQNDCLCNGVLTPVTSLRGCFLKVLLSSETDLVHGGNSASSK